MCSIKVVLMVGLGGTPHRFLCQCLERILAPDCGKRLVAVLSRREALTVLLRQTVSVILTAPQLPDGVWHELIRDTAPMLARPQVIIVALEPGAPTREEALALGARDLIAGPSAETQVQLLIESADRDWACDCARFHAASSPAGDPDILAVDDEPAILELITRALQREGLAVSAAQNGWQAAELLRHYENLAVVILDWQLPGMAGDEVLDHLSAIRPGIRTIVISGGLLAETETVFLRHKVEVFLSKPFPPNTLVAAAKSAVAASREARAVHWPRNATPLKF